MADYGEDPAERFDRMRWENIAFCGFQLWFCVMAYDSVCCLATFNLDMAWAFATC
jgi:hypothetical protein